MEEFNIAEFLKGSLAVVVPQLGKLSDEQLAAVYEAENSAEHTRTTLLKSIEREQSKREELAAEAKKAAQLKADQAAQAAGFADAKSHAAALALAKRKPKAKRKAAQPKPLSAKVADDGMAQAREFMASGESLSIGFGDQKRLNPDIDKETCTMREHRGRIGNVGKVVMRTAKLNRTTTVSHAYLLHDKTVLAVRELAAPLITNANQQIVFSAGSLAFN